MALAAPSAAPFAVAGRLPSWLANVGVVSVSAWAFLLLVPPAIATGGATPSDAPVSVRLVGRLSTAGLPVAPALSRLSLRNEGAGAVSWSARPSIGGSGGAGVRIEAWLAGDGPCAAPTRLISPTDWSRDPVASGGSIDLCVRVSATGTTGGTATPGMTVAARPART
jgi:hypothetical protein